MKLSDSPRSDGPTREAVVALSEDERNDLLDELLVVHREVILQTKAEHAGHHILLEYDFNRGEFVFVDSSLNGRTIAEMGSRLDHDNPSNWYVSLDPDEDIDDVPLGVGIQVM